VREPRPATHRRSLRRTGVALVVACVLALSACGSDDAAPFAGNTLDPAYVVPDVALTDTEGEPFSLAADTDKRLTLVFFGYTRCPDICPAVLNRLAVALTRLDDAQRDEVDVVMVSSDPDHDTPEVLRDYLDDIDESFIGLTSDFDTVVEVGRALAVGIDRQDPGGHTTQIMGVDITDQAPVYWSQDTTPAQFAADIQTLLEDS
jgi:protein SCO1/2